MSDSTQTTALLSALRRGDPDAGARLLPLVQRELHRLATAYMKRERPDHTLQPTALMDEAYLKLLGYKGLEWRDRAHFVAVAATVMRQILVDHARKHNAKIRGEGRKAALDDIEGAIPAQDIDLIALDEALTELGRVEPRQAKVIELRFFGGLSVEESAEVLETSPRSVKRDWRLARIWLHRRLSGQPGV